MPVPDYARSLAEYVEESIPAPEYTATEIRLLDAALELLAHHSERRLTADDIAAAAKVGRGSIFRCFGSKDALFTAVYDREVRVAMSSLRTATASAVDAVDALIKAFEALHTITTGHAVLQRLATAEPERLIELMRSGEPSGMSLMHSILRNFASNHPSGAKLDAGRLDVAVEFLSELHFARLFLARRSYDEASAATVRQVVAQCLS